MLVQLFRQRLNGIQPPNINGNLQDGFHYAANWCIEDQPGEKHPNNKEQKEKKKE
jgi:hypothetical protein